MTYIGLPSNDLNYIFWKVYQQKTANS